MNTKPIYLWNTRYEVSHASGSAIHLLKIDVTPGHKHPFGRYPVPAYDHSYDAESITLSMQANGGETREGTIGGPRWYALDMNYRRRRLGGKSPLMAWFSRIFPQESPGWLGTDIENIISTLQAKAVRVAHSSELDTYVPLEHWERAQDYRLYLDTGVREGSCTVNAYARTGADQATITRAVTEAMRKCDSLATAELAKWINDGSRWSFHQRGADHYVSNTPLERILGTPAPAASQAAA